MLLARLLSNPTLSIRGGISLLQPRGGEAILKPPPPLVLKAINRKEEDGAGHIKFHTSFLSNFYVLFIA